MFVSRSKVFCNNKYHSLIVDDLMLEVQAAYMSWSVATKIYHVEIL